MRQVVVLHGWSDTSKSFKPLIAFLKANGYKATSLFLGDYESLRDDVTIDDVALRMEAVVRERMARPAGARDKLNKTFDLIVHSTGGLLARRWISEYYKDGGCPVRNFLMLAPANYGSALAHSGRSVLGRAFKGYKTGFEVGEEMLYALELGSPFQWDLAQRDIFVPLGRGSATRLYAPDQIRPFVIVGTHPYTELSRRLINENGSDGTVRVAAANLNAQGMTVDFTTDLLNPLVTKWKRRGGATTRFPLAVLPDRTHASICDPKGDGFSKSNAYHRRLGKLILEALATSNAAQYQSRISSWDQVSLDTRRLAGKPGDAYRRQQFGSKKPNSEFFHEYYQLVVRAEDQFGDPVNDFFIEFVPKPTGVLHYFGSFGNPSAYFYDEVLENTHRHKRDPSTCCFYIDRYDLTRAGGFYSMLPANSPKGLSLTATATDPGPLVSYFARGDFARGGASKRGVVHLHDLAKPGRWLKRHTTHFIKLIIPRIGDKTVFRLKRG